MTPVKTVSVTIGKPRKYHRLSWLISYYIGIISGINGTYTGLPLIGVPTILL